MNKKSAGARAKNESEIFTQEHAPTIKAESKIYTACGDGKAHFIAVNDIAAVATRLLTSEAPLKNTSCRVFGPQLLTYDDVSI